MSHDNLNMVITHTYCGKCFQLRRHTLGDCPCLSRQTPDPRIFGTSKVGNEPVPRAEPTDTPEHMRQCASSLSYNDINPAVGRAKHYLFAAASQIDALRKRLNDLQANSKANK